MGFNPGVVDNSGQIRAQGMIQSSGLLADNFKGLINEYNQNKQMTSQAIGKFEGAVRANPEMLKFLDSENPDPTAPPEAVKAFAKLRKNGTLALKDAAMLSTFADSYSSTKQEAQMAQLRQQQIAALQAKSDQDKKDEAALAAALTPYARGANGQATQGGKQLPFDMSAFLGDYFNKGGSPNSIDKIDQVLKIFAPKAEKAADIVFPSLDELQKQYPSEKFDYNFVPSPDGRVAVTGGKISPRAPMQPVPEVPNPMVEKIYTDLSKERSDVVVPALNSMRAYDQINSMLNGDEGKIISGAFANQELAMKRVANALGANFEDVKNTEKLRALYAVPVANIVRQFGSGTGISDKDREYAQKAAGGEITLNAETIKELARIGKQVSDGVLKAYQERLDKAFPEDSKQQQFLMARNSLMVMSPKKAQEAQTKADSILSKYGIK